MATQINIQLEPEIIEYIDTHRGGVSRSRFARHVILIGLKEEQTTNKARTENIVW